MIAANDPYARHTTIAEMVVSLIGLSLLFLSVVFNERARSRFRNDLREIEQSRRDTEAIVARLAAQRNAGHPAVRIV